MSATETVTLTRAPATGDPQAAAPPAAVEIPRRLGAVELFEEIGKGGMGVVWRGRHTLLNRDVAVKFLLNVPGSDEDPNFTAFVEGARAAAALRHKGLNAVLHADVVNGVPYIVMEFLEGPSLSKLLHRAEKLPPGVVRVILEGVCDAVGELHDHGFIHRDIKPGNIILSPDGTVVLTDFGLACQRPVQTLGAKVESVCGTPAYMAPEMFDRTVSARSDVYAIGAMAFELFVGFPPFDGPFEVVRHAHLQEPVPRDKLVMVPPAMVPVVERAMNKSPMYRYKSARHMLRAVEEAFGEMDPLVANRARGESDLVTLIAKMTRATEAADRPMPTPEQGATYYDRLATLVESRKKSGDPVGSETPDPGVETPDPASLVERVERDLACARCGYNLRAQPVTGRCPECLLLVRLTLNPEKAASPPRRPGPQAPAAQPGPSTPTEGEKPGFVRAVRQLWSDLFGR